MQVNKTQLERGFKKLYIPFEEFIQDQTTSSVLLIICVVIAMIAANSEWATQYDTLVEVPLGLVAGEWTFKMSLKHWVNDGLMSYFFFLLGIEIKKELLVGEIRNLDKLIPVAAAATGGMLMPALFYYLFNSGSTSIMGWGIPIATDTAFAIGALILLGARVPITAFAFLTALAIIDDIGAILVISVFYTETINLSNLLLATILFAVLVVANALGVRKALFYFIVAIGLWIAMLGSGVHATIAGLLVAATVPAKAEKGPSWFLQKVQNLTRKFEKLEDRRPDAKAILAQDKQHEVVEDLQTAARKATTPLKRWESILEHPVALFVLPIFALVNAGVKLDWHSISLLWSDPVALGILSGLVLGKGIGIPLFSAIAVWCNWGQLPQGLTLRHMIGLGLLSGMGFTMSMLIAALAFDSPSTQLVTAKSAILLATTIAGVCGYLWLRYACLNRQTET